MEMRGTRAIAALSILHGGDGNASRSAHHPHRVTLNVTSTSLRPDILSRVIMAAGSTTVPIED